MSLIKTYYQKWRILNGLRILPSINEGTGEGGNSIEAQEAAVREAGAEEIYADAFTGTKKHRPQLDKLLKVIQNGDKVVVTKLDRIAMECDTGNRPYRYDA